MARVSQWLTARNQFADWNTDKRTEEGAKVSLEFQNFFITAHPLPMGAMRYCVGLQPLGLRLISKSRFTNATVDEAPLIDYLALEDNLAAIVTEDTGERIGLG